MKVMRFCGELNFHIYDLLYLICDSEVSYHG